ncbi:MAG: SusC/RagA family TonB-linked outer membrane protein [Bernardetiaceae bacterium]|jgi:TonB-linked SusC/RagA family outer membrane protein|nr:SusC/RagA family TonB-linked outer membrane protein [Bernardetiaceae bacterium]
MKKKLLLFWALALGLIGPALAQRNLTGRVTAAEDGAPLPGVSILLKGTTTGTVTDVNGDFRLRLPTNEGGTLVFSYVGYVTQELALGAQTVINLSLATDTKTLREVVVTSLGIEREKEALGYAVQSVKGEDLTLAREVNIINSLQGRVPGMQLSQAATGAGGSTRIVLRGANSLAGTDNNALIVIDGVPMDNTNNRTPGRFGGIDYGTGASLINPDDVERIDVLTGPNAAALYGERAAAGVIMITTKKGTQKQGIGVQYNANATFETPLILPDFQNEYGQGVGGQLPTSTDGTLNIPRNIESSWGPRMTGQSVRDWTGQVRPYEAQPDNIRDFFRTGQTYNNNLSLNAGGEKATFRFSLGSMNNRGIMPNSSLDRLNFLARGTAQITKKLSVDAKANYIRQSSFNRPNLTDNPDNPMYGFIYMPRSIRLDDLRTFEDANGNPVTWAATGVDPNNGFPTSRRQNPFWSIYKNTNEDLMNRIIAFASIKYEFTDWLNLQLRAGTDYYNHRMEERTATRTLFESSRDRAKYVITNHNVVETNADVLLSFRKKFGDDLTVSASGGGNIRLSKFEEVGAQTAGLNVPNLFTIANGAAPVPLYGISERQTNSLYASGQVGYKDYLYLDVSARNDWASTLPRGNWSYFYPAASLSFVLTDAIKLDQKVLSYGKLRASIAQVGGAAQPYQLALNYGLGLPHANQGTGAIRTQLPNVDLKPQITQAIELGADLRFVNDRFGLDVTWYKKNTFNQIFTPPISATSGFTSTVINAGNVQNQGWEVALRLTPLQLESGLKWDVQVNYTRNRSKIVSTGAGINNFFIGNDRNVTVAASPDRPFGDFRGRGFQRDPEGRIVVDAQGLPLIATQDVVIGNYLPLWQGGLNNIITWKGFRANVLVDMRMGGDILSLSNIFASENGNAAATLAGRAEWYAGTGGILVDGVVANADGSFTPNTRFVDPEAYWRRISTQNGAVAEAFVYSGTFIKLRELTFGYTFNKTQLKRLPFTALGVSIVGRNLALLLNNLPGFDPDVSSYNTGNVQGIESTAFPSTRSFGLNLTATF